MKELFSGLFIMFCQNNNIIQFVINYMMFFYVSVYLITISHEFGHYVMAKLCHKKNVKVQIGSGLSVQIGDWSIGLLPTVFKTTYDNYDNSFAIVIAGVLSNLFLHILLMPINDPYIMLFNILLLINIFGNIIPSSCLMTDGYLALSFLFRKNNNS